MGRPRPQESIRRDWRQTRSDKTGDKKGRKAERGAHSTPDQLSIRRERKPDKRKMGLGSVTDANSDTCEQASRQAKTNQEGDTHHPDGDKLEPGGRRQRKDKGAHCI